MMCNSLVLTQLLLCNLVFCLFIGEIVHELAVTNIGGYGVLSLPCLL